VAGVTLLVVSIWLKRRGRPVIYTALPMVFVALATLGAMTGEVLGYFTSARWLLAGLGGVILACDVWILLEGLRLLLGEAGPEPEPQGG